MKTYSLAFAGIITIQIKPEVLLYCTFLQHECTSSSTADMNHITLRGPQSVWKKRNVKLVLHRFAECVAKFDLSSHVNKQLRNELIFSHIWWTSKWTARHQRDPVMATTLNVCWRRSRFTSLQQVRSSRQRLWRVKRYLWTCTRPVSGSVWYTNNAAVLFFGNSNAKKWRPSGAPKGVLSRGTL